MKLRIFKQQNGRFHFGDADSTEYQPIPESLGYAGTGNATKAAIDWAHRTSTDLESITGRADKRVCREFGIKFVDPRKSERGGAPRRQLDAALFQLWKETREGRVTPTDFRKRARSAFGDAKEEWQPGE